MRYFLLKNGSDVVKKSAYGGDASAADELIQKEAGDLEVFEVDQATFDSTPITPVQTKEQTDWQAEKGKGDSAGMITFIAKQLGLE